MPSTLFETTNDGQVNYLLTDYKYTDLNHDQKETRFLVLHPYSGDKWAGENHVRCTIETQFLAKEDPVPYTAVFNARGYREITEAIEVDGKKLFITVALATFLRHFRQPDRPIRLWIRQICLNELDNSERTRYWTRPYVDSIYGKAESLIDMSRTVSDLVDKDDTLRMETEAFTSWDRTWKGTADNFGFRDICPVKLGKQPSSENPVDSYGYMPLDMVADEIRVLIIEGAKESTTPIKTSLAHFPIYCGLRYNAISYARENTNETEEITVTGLKMTIKKSLANVVRSIRQKTPTAVWIDAICIDQNNLIERNRQTKRIADIFHHSAAVMCYIGSLEDDSDTVTKFSEHLRHSLVSRYDNTNRVHNGNDDPLDLSSNPQACGALYRLLTRPYFRRIWILQETATASKVRILCGDMSFIDLQRLEAAIDRLQDLLRDDAKLADQIVEATPGLTRISLEELSYIRKVLYFRHLAMRSIHSSTSQIDKVVLATPGFLETAILTRDFDAIKPSDKIYALWNIAQDKGDFEFAMDYAQTTVEAYASFASAWASHSGSLDIIGASEPYSETNGFYNSAPSWCPDWSVPSRISCMVRKEVLGSMASLGDMDGPLYSADGDMKQQPGDKTFFHFDKNVLHSTGAIIDKIATDILSNEVDELEMVSQEYCCAIRLHFDQKGIANPYSDPTQAAWAAMFGDNIAAWPRREGEADGAEVNLSEEGYVCLPELSRHIRYHAQPYSRSDMREHTKAVLRGRRMVITEKGYIALAPAIHTFSRDNSPWYLAILATCSAPVLLSEVSEGVYKFGGTCFVQGWMDGEMIIGDTGANSAEEFWQSPRVEKLRVI